MFETIIQVLNDCDTYNQWIAEGVTESSINVENTVYEWDIDKEDIIYPRFTLLLASDNYKSTLVSFSGDYEIDNAFIIRFHELISKDDSTREKISAFMNDILTIMKEIESYKIVKEWSIEKGTPFRNEIESHTHMIAVDINITLFTGLS